jgi:hypothetical protein
MEEKIRGLEAEVQKIRARPREIEMVESEEATSEDEKEDKRSKAKKAKTQRENEDTESIFRDKDSGEADVKSLRFNHMRGMRSLKSGKEFEAWVNLRLKEQSARATSFLLDWADAKGIDVRGAKKRSTIVKRMAAEFDNL